MSKQGITPGRWRVAHVTDGFIIEADQPAPVGLFGEGEKPPPVRVVRGQGGFARKADAHLSACAPEMLEALEETLAMWVDADSYCPPNGQRAATIGRLRELVARARAVA